MNCAECRDELVAYVEELSSPESRQNVARHLEECAACRDALTELAELRDRLVEDGQAVGHRSLETSVMDRIVREGTFKLRTFQMRKRYGRAGVGLVAAVAAVTALVVVWPGTGNGVATAAEVLARGIDAVAHLQSVYIQARMRTIAHDNFELIGLDYDFVDHQIWKQFGDLPRWRIEKPGRVVVMDGESALLWIKSSNKALRAGPNSGVVEWLRPLLDPHKVLESEQRLAQERGSELSLSRKKGADGGDELVLTVEAKARGDFTNDWLKNKSISASDNRRVYRFDADTHLLEAMQVYVHAEAGDVLVFEITQIDYDAGIDPSLFSLTLPKDVVWFQKPDVLPDNEKYTDMEPDEAARAFFQACADEDWDEVLKYWPMTALSQKFKDGLGGLEIISLGEPFQSGRYPGWFVPYEIKLKSGNVKKWNLAIRNDNPAKRWQADGGL
mgnify:CR=1 FL=1